MLTIISIRRYSLLCKQCVFVAAYIICNKYGYLDIISWTYWICTKMDLPLVDVSVLVWRVLSRVGFIDLLLIDQ